MFSKLSRPLSNNYNPWIFTRRFFFNMNLLFPPKTRKAPLSCWSSSCGWTTLCISCRHIRKAPSAVRQLPSFPITCLGIFPLPVLIGDSADSRRLEEARPYSYQTPSILQDDIRRPFRENPPVFRRTRAGGPSEFFQPGGV